MTTERKLDFILKAIASAKGPEQHSDEPDEVFVLRLVTWIMRHPPSAPQTIDVQGTCGCKTTHSTILP